MGIANRFEQLDPAHAGHALVGDDEVRAVVSTDGVEGIGGAAEVSHRVALPQYPHEGIEVRPFIIDNKNRSAQAVVGRLEEYFRRSVAAMLLYPHEVDQFGVVSAAADDLCTVYGPEHLLRLFTKLPVLLAQTDLRARPLDLTLRCMQDVLRFLQIHQNKYFDARAYFKPVFERAAEDGAAGGAVGTLHASRAGEGQGGRQAVPDGDVFLA